MSLRNLVVIALAIVGAVACRTIASKSRYASLFAEAVTKIDDYALLPTDEQSLYDSAMKGMLGSLDEYSQYIAGDSFRRFEQHLKQEFGGVGMFVGVHPKTKELTVTATLPETPAQRAGIRPGDVLLRIDETSTQGMLPGDAVDAIQGPIGQGVNLVLRREQQEFEKTVVRAAIAVRTVRGEKLLPDGSWNYLLPEDQRIAYVHITDFSEKTGDELREVLEQGIPRAQALIVDLRSNGGGLLDDAVEICDMFLDRPEPIVEIRGRDRKLLEAPFRSSGACLFPTSKPLVLLIDHYSASASEIMAACLQDLNRATVIGEASYGKGTVQSVVPLERNRSSIKITTGTWWTPAGNNVDRNPQFSGRKQPGGVQPDPGFEFEFDDDTRFQIDLVRARRQFQSLDIFGADASDVPETGPLDAENGAKPQINDDPVFQRAVQLLTETLDRRSTTCP